METTTAQRESEPLRTSPLERHTLWWLSPLSICIAMVCTILLLDAVIALRGLWYHEALLTQLGAWSIWPSLLVFPGQTLVPPFPGSVPLRSAPAIGLSWQELPWLFCALLLLFLVYLLALYVARRSGKPFSFRYIVLATLLFGLLYASIPVVTSPDLFSYIAYARMGVIYHLNPLTTVPTAIRFDDVYKHVIWIDQPSAYGPTWVMLTSALQWLLILCGTSYVLPMVIALRLFGLVMHLCSTALIWSIAGHLGMHKGKHLATLAFAWNPFLLLEACINAHNDTTLLCLILLALWVLVRRPQPTMRTYIVAAVVLTLATCLKITTGLLIPGFLLFVWARGRPQQQWLGRWRAALSIAAIYGGGIVLLYAPFWQNGEILGVILVNPTASRNSSSLATFFAQFYNALASAFGAPLSAPIGSPAEHVTHLLSISIFLMVYALLCWRAVRVSHQLNEPIDLIRWWAIVWLLYCALGSPWFWPWYAVIFFGLFALLEAQEVYAHDLEGQGARLLAVRLLALSMLTLNCFYTWGPVRSFIPGLPGFQWAYLAGLWAWMLPLSGLLIRFNMRVAQWYHPHTKELFDRHTHATVGAGEPRRKKV